MKDLTIVIPSYKSRTLIINQLDLLSNNNKIIIIENSQDKKLKELIKKKYKNTKIILKNNIGFGRAINLGAKFVKTKYFLAINPDTKISTNSINNLVKTALKLKVFGGISPMKHNNKINIDRNKVVETKNLYGAAMLFDTKIFKKIDGFDKNIFLYYEENDFFLRCRKLNIKLYIAQNSHHFHTSLKSTSSIMENQKEKFYSYLLSGWHGQWSKFYFYKKHKGYLNSIIKCTPSLISNIVKLMINILINFNKAKFYYFKIEGLIVSMIGIKSFKRSIYDK